MKAEEYKTILSTAIGNEIEAYEFYQGVSQKTQDKVLKTLFHELAEQEKNHRSFLEGFLTSGAPLHLDKADADYKISKTFDKPKLSLAMKPADAIALAIKKEEEAMNMYAALATSITDPDQKQMFESLANMEQHHKVRLEGLYTNMAYPEVW